MEEKIEAAFENDLGFEYFIAAGVRKRGKMRDLNNTTDELPVQRQAS